LRDATTAEQWSIRIVVPAALLGATVAAVLLPHAQPLPAVALGSRWILYALRALALFYGFLLLFVPLVRALHGVLPIELSKRRSRRSNDGRTSCPTSSITPPRTSRLSGQAALVLQREDRRLLLWRPVS
jgi:hypothetical protein